MRLTGFEAIQFAEREGRSLNKAADNIDEAASGLSAAEAEAIAADRPELIWLDVASSDYYGEPKNMENPAVSRSSQPWRDYEGDESHLRPCCLTSQTEH